MPSCSTERACEKQAGEDHPPVFLWAFSWLRGWFLFLSPTAHCSHQRYLFYASGGFLSFNSERKSPKNASRNPWFLHFLFRVQELLLKSRRSEELVCFYSRCRFIGRLKGLTTLPSENSSPQSHCHSEETAEAPPVADEARRFRGSVPVFTPQRGWKPADTTVQTVRRLVVGIRIPRR